MFTKTTITIIALLISGATHAKELNEYLREAIRNGQAAGVVTGAIAEQITEQTGSPEPVQAAVIAVRDFPGQDCKRLRVMMVQEKVKTKDGKSATLAIPAFELNMCLNGYPPEEPTAPSEPARN